MSKLLKLTFAAVIAATFLTAGGAAATASAAPDAPKPGTSAAAPNQQAKEPAIYASVGVRPMAGGYTHQWGAYSGCVRLYLTGLGLPNAYPVVASASQRDGAIEFLGDARITVHNVSVSNNLIAVRVCIEWSSALPINVHYVWG